MREKEEKKKTETAGEGEDEKAPEKVEEEEEEEGVKGTPGDDIDEGDMVVDSNPSRHLQRSASIRMQRPP